MILSASPEEYPEIAESLARIFSDDPGFARMCSSQDSIAELLLRTLPLSTTDVVRTADGRLRGVALWRSPSQLATPIDYSGVTDRAKIEARVAEVAHYVPLFPHWYLFVLAALEPGQGVGSELLSHGLKRAGATPVYLEATTPRLADLYRKHGFVALGYLPDTDEGKRPSELAMWHE